MTIDSIKNDIINHSDQTEFTSKGWKPLFDVSRSTKILIIGQAPGIKTQEKNLLWMDQSGKKLRSWLGVDEKTFYDNKLFGQMPMDFYFPGKSKSGDKPPRKDFASMWHPKLLSLMPNVKLIILIGQYSQSYYLGKDFNQNLTQTVKSYNQYLPKYFPLPHPSPLNLFWLKKNPWFETDVLPVLQQMIQEILHS